MGAARTVDSALGVATRDGAIALDGPLVFDTAGEALSRTLTLLPATGTAVIDLGGITRADSAALALLVEWRRVARTRGLKIELRALPAQLRALAAATGLDKLVDQAYTPDNQAVVRRAAMTLEPRGISRD